MMILGVIPLYTRGSYNNDDDDDDDAADDDDDDDIGPCNKAGVRQ